jgi:hypothetical protein
VGMVRPDRCSIVRRSAARKVSRSASLLKAFAQRGGLRSTPVAGNDQVEAVRGRLVERVRRQVRESRRQRGRHSSHGAAAPGDRRAWRSGDAGARSRAFAGAGTRWSTSRSRGVVELARRAEVASDTLDGVERKLGAGRCGRANPNAGGGEHRAADQVLVASEGIDPPRRSGSGSTPPSPGSAFG